MTDLTELTINLRETTDTIGVLNKRLKDLKEKKAKIETSLLNIMDDMGNGMRSLSTDAGTVSIKELIVAKVDDWEKFYDYIKETGDFHLLERRPANVAFREMLEAEQEVPGVSPFTKRSISLTK